MDTKGLPELGTASGAAGPGMRVCVGARIVLEATEALAGMLGRSVPELEGRPLDDLWAESERDAIRARFDDVVLLGSDSFGAVALAGRSPAGIEPPLVEVLARFEYVGGERLDVWLKPVERRSTGLAANADQDRGGGAGAAAGPSDAGETADLGDPDGDRAAADDVGHLSLAALEATGAAVLLVDADGRVGGATRPAERLLGRAAPDLRHQAIGSVLAMSPTASEALTAARAEGQRQTVIVDDPGRGDHLVVEWVPGLGPGSGYAVLSAPEGGPPSADTERLRLQAQLVSHVSHDLRGALASTYSGLRTLVADLLPGSPQHETAVQSLEELRRASRIVDEVLALSRPGRLRRAELDLGALLSEVVGRHRADAADRGVEILLEAAPAVTVAADRSGLERSLGNLVENAIRAMPEGGTLSVRSTLEDRVGPGAAVVIADTGRGIPVHLQATVFDPFVSDTEGGSGLGLTITRHIVVAHGGQVGFESEQGVGTTFTVWLPRVE